MTTPAQDSGAPKPSSLVNEQNPNGVYTDRDYNPVPENWFTAKPYGFKFTDKNKKPTIMYLPISPSNLTISTSFATNIISTLYGTVEEHSPVKYYDISIEGTTGMAPKYVNPAQENGIPPTQPGRSFFSIKQTLGSLSVDGFFSQTLSRLKSVVNDTTALFKTPEVLPGVYTDQSGYVAFHNLYQFLLKYKKDASGADSATRSGEERTIHPLLFLNYKDCNSYKVVIKSFILRRDKEDPMLYNYSITMRGYDLTDINDSTLNIENKTEQNILEDLGLNGVDGSTYLKTAKRAAVTAKSILGTASTGINLFGR